MEKRAARPSAQMELCSPVFLLQVLRRHLLVRLLLLESRTQSPLPSALEWKRLECLPLTSQKIWTERDWKLAELQSAP